MPAGLLLKHEHGQAWFRDLSVVKIAAPASDGDPSFKLDPTAKPVTTAQK